MLSSAYITIRNSTKRARRAGILSPRFSSQVRKFLFSSFSTALGTVATTIGYGNIAPSTNTGKVFTLVFSLIGIPYFGILTFMVVEKPKNAVREIQTTLCKRVLSEDIKRAVNSIKDQISYGF